MILVYIYIYIYIYIYMFMKKNNSSRYKRTERCLNWTRGRVHINKHTCQLCKYLSFPQLHNFPAEFWERTVQTWSSLIIHLLIFKPLTFCLNVCLRQFVSQRARAHTHTHTHTIVPPHIYIYIFGNNPTFHHFLPSSIADWNILPR